MRIYLLIILCFFRLLAFSVTKTVGSGGDYSTLKDAFDAINAGSVTGNIILQVTSNITETATASLNANGSGSASYNTINIYPTGSGFIISGNFDSTIIKLNGADSVTIDGRVNTSCGSANLIIKNTNTGTSASTISFINSAESNIIKYCNVTGAGTGSNTGTISFLTSSAGNGNSKNTIANCNIYEESTTPTNGIFSLGSASYVNSSNYILNNNIYNFFNASASSVGINLLSHTSDWVIRGNHIYQESTRTASAAASNYGIYINNTSGNNFTIQDNYIGGSTTSCGGSAWTVSSSAFTSNVYGMYLNVGTSTASSLQNNNIQNFVVSSTASNIFYGLYIAEGALNIGTWKGNNISSVTSTSWVDGGNTYGIYISTATGTINIYNNVISDINAAGQTTAHGHSLFGIRSLSTGALIIYNNTLGDVLTANSLYASNAYTGSSAQNIHGIVTADATIEKNTIAGLFNESVSTSNNNRVYGIRSVGANITDNVIRDLTNNAGLTNNPGSVTGLYIDPNGSTVTISGNELFNMSSNYNGANSVIITSIYLAGTGTANITNNFIYAMTNLATGTSSKVQGIAIAAANANLTNNIINIGAGATENYEVIGIDIAGTSSTYTLYSNTVYIQGTIAASTTATYAFRLSNDTNTPTLKNNIFHNTRSNTSGIAKHYAIYLSGTTNLTINYNDYYAPGTGGTLGYLGGDQTSLALWQAATGQDANSLNANPVFASAGSNLSINYFSTAAGLATGATATGVTTDYHGLARAATPRIGAIEGSYWDGASSSAFSVNGNWQTITNKPSNGDVLAFGPSSSLSNHCILDQDYTASDIINHQNTYDLDINAYTLTITGDIKLSNGAQIDAAGSGGRILFKGSAPQFTPLTGGFVSDEMDTLEIDNAYGLTLGSDITINGKLALTNGVIHTGPYKIILIDGAVISGGSDSSFVDGTIQKIGDNAFTFHVGNNTQYAPIGISAPSVVTDAFSASYTNYSPKYVYCDTLGAGIDHVSNMEYWNLTRDNGSSNVKVRLSWDTRSGGVTDTSELRVLHWTGSYWKDEGKTVVTGADSAGTITSGFVTSFSPFTLGSRNFTNPLPISLLYFYSTCEQGLEKIKWATSSEINNEFFELEKSLDAKNWELVAKVKGAINSNETKTYSLVDDSKKATYYRLKQIDINGKNSISNIISSECEDVTLPFKFDVYPNPVDNNLIIEVSQEKENQTYSIMSVLGQTVKSGTIKGIKTSVELTDLPSGIYMVNMEGKSIPQKKIVKK